MVGSILTDKLESLRRCIERIEQRRVASAAALVADPDTQDIISLNLTRAVQLCVDMAMHVIASSKAPAPRTMGEAFDAMAEQSLISEDLRDCMKAAVGFRNIAVHSYRAIDWEIVHFISHAGLEDFRAFAQAIVGLLEQAR